MNRPREDAEAASKKRPNLFLRSVLFLVTFALVAGAVVLVVFRDKLNIDAFRRSLTYHAITANEDGQAELITHPGGSKVDFAALGDAYLICSSTGIRLYTAGGTQFYERVASMEHPSLTAGNALAAVYNVGGDSVYVYNSKEECAVLSTDGDHSILSARMNPSGYLAVTAEASGYKAAVTVYSPKQEKRMQLNFSSAFVMDAAVSSGDRGVAVVTLGQENGAFESRLNLYTLDSEEAALNVSLGNTTVLDLRYDDSLVWTVGESALVTTAVSNGEQHRYDFSGLYLKDFSLGGDDFAALLLGRYRAGSSSDLIVVNQNGEERTRLALSEQVRSISASGRYIAVLTADQLTIYTANDLEVYSTLSDLQSIRSVVMRADGSAILVGGSTAKLYLPS